MKRSLSSVMRSLCRTTAAVVVLSTLPAAAQNQLWIEQLGTSSNDSAHAAAADGSGGVYLSGGTDGSLGGPNAGAHDACLARYDGAGNQIWIRQLGTSAYENSVGAAADGSGGVYVTGWTEGSFGGPNGGNDAWLARYDSAGNQLWVQQFGTSADDSAHGVAAGGSGGVYVSGGTQGSLGGPNAGGIDAWLARYDNAGNQLWVQQFGTSSHDRASAAAADGSGGVYVTGYTNGSLGGPNAGLNDVWLARYDSAGNQLGIEQFGTSGYDFASAAAADGSGGVYVSGRTSGSFGGGNAGGDDAWLVRYDSAWNQLWMGQFGTSESDQALAAAADGSGGVYVSGRTDGSLGGPNAGSHDAWLARHDSAGNLLWIQQLGTSAYDAGAAAAADGSGGVYVTGWTEGSLGGPNAGGKDAWLARYDGSTVNAYCFGDGSGTICPCANGGTSGAGCAHSLGTGGLLSTAGTSGAAADDLVLLAQLPPGQPALLFVGTNALHGGFGVPFGDGLRCVGGVVVRLGIETPSVTGVATWGPALGAQGGWSAGDTRYFQTWYRDPSGPCGSGFNLTNGVEVLFSP